MLGPQWLKQEKKKRLKITRKFPEQIFEIPATRCIIVGLALKAIWGQLISAHIRQEREAFWRLMSQCLVVTSVPIHHDNWPRHAWWWRAWPHLIVTQVAKSGGDLGPHTDWLRHSFW